MNGSQPSLSFPTCKLLRLSPKNDALFLWYGSVPPKRFYLMTTIIDDCRNTKACCKATKLGKQGPEGRHKHIKQKRGLEITGFWARIASRDRPLLISFTSSSCIVALLEIHPGNQDFLLQCFYILKDPVFSLLEPQKSTNKKDALSICWSKTLGKQRPSEAVKAVLAKTEWWWKWLLPKWLLLPNQWMKGDEKQIASYIRWCAFYLRRTDWKPSFFYKSLASHCQQC